MADESGFLNQMARRCRHFFGVLVSHLIISRLESKHFFRCRTFSDGGGLELSTATSKVSHKLIRNWSILVTVLRKSTQAETFVLPEHSQSVMVLGQTSRTLTLRRIGKCFRMRRWHFELDGCRNLDGIATCHSKHFSPNMSNNVPKNN